MNTVQFDAIVDTLLADVRAALKFFPVAGVILRKELVSPNKIVWVPNRKFGAYDNKARTISLGEKLREPENLRQLFRTFAHELAHAQQIGVGTYQYLRGWDHMWAYARCPYEFQANLVGDFCGLMWDAKMEGRNPADSPQERWQEIADWVLSRRLERMKSVQAELPALKGLSDAELYPHARRLGLSWCPTSG